MRLSGLAFPESHLSLAEKHTAALVGWWNDIFSSFKEDFSSRFPFFSTSFIFSNAPWKCSGAEQCQHSFYVFLCQILLLKSTLCCFEIKTKMVACHVFWSCTSWNFRCCVCPVFCCTCWNRFRCTSDPCQGYTTSRKHFENALFLSYLPPASNQGTGLQWWWISGWVAVPCETTENTKQRYDYAFSNDGSSFL